MGAGPSSGGKASGSHRSNVEPLSAVERGYDVAIPEDTKAISARIRGELSLLSIVRDPQLHRLFEGWLEENSAESILKFWVECDDYNTSAQQSGRNMKHLQARAADIYQRYLEPGCSLTALPLDVATCEEIAEIVAPRDKGAGGLVPFRLPRKNERLLTVFHAAMRKTFLALLFDYLPHFLASETEGFWKKVAEGSSARVGGRQDGQGGSSAVNAEPSSGITAGDDFLENPKVVRHIKHYLASLEADNAGGDGGGKHGKQHVGIRCLDCLQDIREYQRAASVEDRRKIWVSIRRRYCGEAGIGATHLDALASCAAAETQQMDHLLPRDRNQQERQGIQQADSSSPSSLEPYPPVSMLDEAYDAIVDGLLLKHLVGYQASVHSWELEESWARERESVHFPPTATATASAGTDVVGTENKATGEAFINANGHDIRKGRDGYRRASNRDLDATGGERTKRISSLPEPRRYNRGGGGGGGVDGGYAGGNSTFQSAISGLPRRTLTEDGLPWGGGEGDRRSSMPLLRPLPTISALSAHSGDTAAVAGDHGVGDSSRCGSSGRVHETGSGANDKHLKQQQQQLLLHCQQRPHQPHLERFTLPGKLKNPQRTNGNDDEGEEEDRAYAVSDSMLTLNGNLKSWRLTTGTEIWRASSLRGGGKSAAGQLAIACADDDAVGGHSSDARTGSGGLEEDLTVDGMECSERDRRLSKEDDIAGCPLGPNIHEVLESPLGLSLFRRHSSELFQEENVALWTQIAHFRAGQYAAPQMGTALEVGEGDSIEVIRARRARLIYETYISEKADKQVNLSSKLQASVKHRIEALERLTVAAPEQEEATTSSITASLPQHRDLFDEIQREVFCLMETNLWVTFKKSRRYKFFASKYRSHHASPFTPTIAGPEEQLLSAVMRNLSTKQQEVRSKHERQQQRQQQQAEREIREIEREVRSRSEEIPTNRRYIRPARRRRAIAVPLLGRRGSLPSAKMTNGSSTSFRQDLQLLRWSPSGRSARLASGQSGCWDWVIKMVPAHELPLGRSTNADKEVEQSGRGDGRRGDGWK